MFKSNCDICNGKTTTKITLYYHVPSIHDILTSDCECCDYKSTQKGTLQQHLKYIHNIIKCN